MDLGSRTWERSPHSTPQHLKPCGLMTAAPTPDWHVFTQIFAQHWDGCKRVYPRYDTRYYDGLVDKMLGCGNPDKMGSIESRCVHGGEGTPLVAMRCQASLCLRCAKVSVDNWVSHVSNMRHEGVIYRPIVLTMPARLRTTLYQPSKDFLRPFMRGGVRGLDDVLSRVSGTPRKGGDLVVMQPHGRHGQYTPHLHLIATSGGWDPQAKQWVPLASVPYPLRRKKWQWPLLTMRRQPWKTREIHRLVDACDTRSRNGVVPNVPKGDVPSRSQSLARSLAKYVGSPPISLRRLDGDDGQRVTYHYRSHKRARVERETVEVSTCIGRMVPHGCPKGFKRRREYGGQATKTFAKLKGLMQEALAKGKGIVKGAITIMVPLPSRQRYQQRTGRDPLRGPHCQSAMEVWRIWPPTSGVIHEELEAIRRGKYASQAPRADPAGRPGCPLRATSGGVPLSLSGLR